MSHCLFSFMAEASALFVREMGTLGFTVVRGLEHHHGAVTTRSTCTLTAGIACGHLLFGFWEKGKGPIECKAVRK
jgi:hypothetical protein